MSTLLSETLFAFLILGNMGLLPGHQDGRSIVCCKTALSRNVLEKQNIHFFYFLFFIHFLRNLRAGENVLFVYNIYLGFCGFNSRSFIKQKKLLKFLILKTINETTVVIISLGSLIIQLTSKREEVSYRDVSSSKIIFSITHNRQHFNKKSTECITKKKLNSSWAIDILQPPPLK